MHMKVVVGIMTHRQNLQKAQLVFDHLTRAVDSENNQIKIFYILGNGGEDPAIQDNKILLSSQDEYGLLPRKTIDFIRFCNSHFDFDYLVKIDDDVYVRDFQELLVHLKGDYCGKIYEINKKNVLTEFMVRTKCAPKINGRNSLYKLSLPDKYIRGGLYALSAGFADLLSKQECNEIEDLVSIPGLEDLMVSKLAIRKSVEMNNLQYSDIVMQVNPMLFWILRWSKSQTIFNGIAKILQMYFATIFKIKACAVRVRYLPDFLAFKRRRT